MTRKLLLLALVPALLGCAHPHTLDQDMQEVTVARLQDLYRSRTYTVEQVVRWHLARMHRYNPVYAPVEDIDEAGALAAARKEDAEGGPNNASKGPLWGVPIVIKENTSVRGRITSDGWAGYKLPGHELIAPRDAPIVAKLRAAGAVILGKTNMPDFAASDTNRSTAWGRTGNAYDVRFSPGGSSGGTVTAVTLGLAVLGNGTDTGNSIRMPAATSAVVGVFPTRGLVSIAGIAPLDWQLDNTGPIARTVTDAAIALDAMAGPDLGDARTLEAGAQPGPYTQYLKPDALQGKRFGVPAFILAGAGIPFQGGSAADAREKARIPLRPETRAAFLRALDGLRAAGATVVFDDAILPESFAEACSHIVTAPYIREGTENFLAGYGPPEYRSAEAYARATGHPLPAVILGTPQPPFAADPQAAADVTVPRARALALYNDTLDRLHLDGFVYPATQMPPPDETLPQDGGISGGPHSDTSWVNMLGVPAVVVPGGWYPGGLPFGLEISARRRRDGDLLGWAYAYEQATHHRRPPVPVEHGLLGVVP